jgi:hypothetical protein
MAKCPVCGCEVKTPSALNVDAWRWLKCPYCAARLERKYPRYLLSLYALLLVITPLSRVLGYRHSAIVYAALAFVVIALLVILLRPQLQVRKRLPEPETRLDLNTQAK